MSAKVAGSVAARSGSFIAYIHYSRAIAIIIIVLGHCITLFDWSDQPRVADLLGDLLGNGTVVFVFLAGFLFEHLSARYRYGSYLQKKLAHVWMPYLIISIPAIVHAVYFSHLETRNPWLAAHSPIHQVAWFYRTGGAHIDFPLWFVPMITLYYVAAPLLMVLVRHRRLCSLVLVPLLIYSMLAHRPRSPNLDTLDLAAYFLSCYVLGIWASHNRISIERWLDRAWPVLLAAFLAFVAAQFWLLPNHGNYEGHAPFSQEHGLIDWIFVQKVLFCFVLLGLTRRYQQRLGRLAYFADVSFAIFIIHGYFVSWGELTLVPKPAGHLLWYVVASSLVLLASLAVVYAIKALLRGRSLYVLGS